MVHADTLRGALRWSAADEAQTRISAVKRTLDSDGSGGGGATSSATKRATTASAAAESRHELRQGLSELDAVRSFLHDHLNTSNRQFLSSGSKDEELHTALQHGLSELEDVRTRLVHTLSMSDTPAAAPAAAKKPPPQPPARGRPPSAGRGRQTTAADQTAPTTATRPSLFEQARKKFQRPTSATVRSSSKAASGESLHGTSEGLRSSTTRLNARPMSATVRSASASANPPAAEHHGSQPQQASSGPGRRSSSEGAPRLATGARARPTSAPVKRGGGDSSATSGVQQPQQQSTGPSSSSTSGDGGGDRPWNQYQDWAQRVMTSVHTRRVMKHRQALQQERRGSGPGASQQQPPTSSSAAGPSPRDTPGSTPPSEPLNSNNTNNATAGSSSSATAAPAPAAPAAASSSSSTAGAKPATATSGATRPARDQRPYSAAFSGLRRAQAAAATTTPGSAPARPQSATVRGAAAAANVSLPGQQQRLDSTAQSLREAGNVAFQQRRYADAAEAYGKALQLEPRSELLYCNRAAAQLMLGKYHQALADAQAAIDIEPKHVKAHWRAAKSCLYLGQTDQARSLYSQAEQLAEASTDREAITAESRAADLVDRCRRCIRLREYSDAVKAADEVLQVFPPSGPCSMPWLCLRAEAALHVDPAEALQTVTRYTSEDPACAEAWFLRGKAVFYTGHDAASTSAALGFLARCREIDAKHNRAPVLQSAIETFAILRDQGNSAYANGRWQEAYVAYTKCLAVDPYNQSLKAIILCNRSAVCIQCERWKDALDDITQSINCNPQNAKAYTRRARVFQQQGNHDAAVKDLQHAAQLYPSQENQERLQQALEQRNRGSSSAAGGAGGKPPQQGGNGSSSFRYFSFAGGGNGGGGGPGARPSTAGASRSASSGGGASRPQSASHGRPGGSNPYSIPRPQSAKAASGASSEPSHYEVLGIGRVADEKVLTRAYRDAALKWHPDKWMTANEAEKTKAEEMFKRISTAYSVLKDPTKKRQYDHSQF